MRSLARSGVLDVGGAAGFESVEDVLTDAPDPASIAQTVHCFTDFENVEKTWRRFETTATGSVYQHFDWCKTWFDVFSSMGDLKPLIVVWSIEGRPALLLPLYIRPVGFGVSEAQFMGNHHANVRVPLLTTVRHDRLLMIRSALHGRVLKRVAEALQEGGHADYMALTSMPEVLDGEINVLAVGPKTRSGLLLFSGGLQDDFDALKAERRSIKSQRKMRKNLKKIRQIGEPQFVLIEEAAALDEVLDVFFEQKGARLHDAGISSAFDVDTNRKFIRNLAHQSFASGSKVLEVYALFVNDEPIAIAGGGLHRDRFSMGINSMTSNARFASHSPGRLSVDRAVERFCNQGVQLFDLGLGENEYKRMWCAPVPLYDVDLALSPKGKVHGALSSVRRFLLNTLRRSPRALKLARRAKFLVYRVRSRSC